MRKLGNSLLQFAELILLLPVIATANSATFSQPPPGCLKEPLRTGYTEWQGNVDGSQIIVQWGFGNETCSTLNSCFGTSRDPDMKLVAQLLPLQVQVGVTIKFQASKTLDVPFGIRPQKVSLDAFESCDITSGTALSDNFTTEEITVSRGILDVGSNYFIAETSDPMFRCQFGFRLNITVKDEDCKGVGEAAMCWNSGRCLSSFSQGAYECQCCYGRSGQYCENIDPCLSNPCENNATCHSDSDDDGKYLPSCDCLQGFYGDRCQYEYDDMCELNQCENNATCIGDKHSYSCLCVDGFTGHHCEVDINECAANPCVQGICVDVTNGHQCYCKPGYTGAHCDITLPHCDTNHCKNTGVCVENEHGLSCHCPRGYSGPDCSVKEDLCNPSPCLNAFECIDRGTQFECICRAGYTGVHCEIDINECASSPCQNGGNCVDMVSAFRCICPHGKHGTFCQYEKQDGKEEDLEGLPFHSPWRKRSPVHNLVLVAGTLGGGVLLALLILLGCYCKVHETYKKLSCKRAVRRGYTRHVDEHTKDQIANSSLNNPRPSVSAILEATSADYSSNRLNSPVKATLKPKRV